MSLHIDSFQNVLNYKIVFRYIRGIEPTYIRTTNTSVKK